MEEKLKKAFSIIYGQYIEIILVSMIGYIKYEAIKHDQEVIRIMKLIKGLMYKFDEKQELTHAMWEEYVLLFRCRQYKFETNQEYLD